MVIPELPISLYPYTVANQVTTITLGGDHPDSTHRVGTFPLPVVWDVARWWDLWMSTSEDEHMWLWHCREITSQGREAPYTNLPDQVSRNVC